MKWSQNFFSASLVLFFLAFVTLFFERAGLASFLKSGTWLLLQPGQKTGSQLQIFLKNIEDERRFFLHGSELLSKLEFSLQQEKNEEDQLVVLRKENQLLREQLGDRTKDAYSTFLMSGFRDRWFIDGGCKDGVQKDAPVLYKDSLVGQVIETHETSSVVATLYDQSWRVPVAIGTESARALLNTSQGTPLVTELSGEIGKDDLVMTAGVAGLPAGILIGRISQVNPAVERGVLESALLEPYFLPHQTSVVQIPVKEGDTCEAQ